MKIPDSWKTRGLPDPFDMMMEAREQDKDITMAYSTLAALAERIIKERLPLDVGYVGHVGYDGEERLLALAPGNLANVFRTEMKRYNQTSDALAVLRQAVKWGVCPIDDQLHYHSARSFNVPPRNLANQWPAATRAAVFQWYRGARREIVSHSSLLRVCTSHTELQCVKCRNYWPYTNVQKEQLQAWGWSRCPKCATVNTLASLKPTVFNRQSLRKMAKEGGILWGTDSN